VENDCNRDEEVINRIAIGKIINGKPAYYFGNKINKTKNR
jgi:hypothetical protein